MIKNEKQYNSAKAKLLKWLKTKEQVRAGIAGEQPAWLVDEQMFGVDEQIKQLSAEIQEYDETVSGKADLPDPSLISKIPGLLISWRIARHLTQRELADLVGMHENQIQKYESENYGGASLQTISKIATAFKQGKVCSEPQGKDDQFEQTVVTKFKDGTGVGVPAKHINRQPQE